MRGIMLFCDQCSISIDLENLSGFIRAVSSGSARSTEQIVMRMGRAKYQVSWDCPLGNLQIADLLGQWLMRMTVLMLILESLA